MLWVIHIFETFDFEGREVETEEMSPRWFRTDAMPPYQDMMIDSKYWHKHWLNGSSFTAYFLIDEEVLKVLDQRIEIAVQE